jgi:hypothetical protein
LDGERIGCPVVRLRRSEFQCQSTEDRYMAHGSAEYSEAELAEKITKLGVDFRSLDPESDPEDEYILDQFLHFIFVQDVAKSVYGDATASEDAKDLAKAVLGMSAAMEKLVAHNRLQRVKIVMEAMIRVTLR